MMEKICPLPDLCVRDFVLPKDVEEVLKHLTWKTDQNFMSSEGSPGFTFID